MGQLLEFDQREFTKEFEQSYLKETGYLYVPNNCVGDKKCNVHVSIHGCGNDRLKVWVLGEGLDYL